jgi:CheY-like chemotaxis protein
VAIRKERDRAMPEAVVVRSVPLRVVFADDDEPTRVLLRVLLGLVEGVEVVGEARDGHEALVLAQETEPHLVILDVNMPRVDGITCAEALLAANPGIQLVVHTADPDSERVRQAAQLGIHVNDKADPDGLVKRLEAAAEKAAETPSAQHRLQTAVLAALLGSVAGQALVVASPDGMIAFYNHRAAKFLRWPFPPRPQLLGEGQASLPTFDLAGKRLYPQERPIGRVLRTRLPMREEEMVVRRFGVLVPIVTGATPLFDDRGGFIGVANYFRTTDRDLTGFEPDLDYLGPPDDATPAG